MNCKNCGNMLSPTDKFCLKCGAPAASAPTQPVMPSAPMQPNPMPMANNTMPVQSNNGGGNKLILIIVGIVAVTAIIIAAMFLVFGNKDEKESGNPETNNGTNTGTNTGTGTGTGDDDEPATPVSTTYTVQFGDFTYDIPNSYMYQSQTDYIEMQNSTYYIQVTSKYGYTYSTVSDDSLIALVNENGWTYVSHENKTVDGKNYLVLNIKVSGYDCVYVFEKTSPLYASIAFGYRLDYTTDTELANEMISILGSTKYNASSNLENKDIEVDITKMFK